MSSFRGALKILVEVNGGGKKKESQIDFEIIKTNLFFNARVIAFNWFSISSRALVNWPEGGGVAEKDGNSINFRILSATWSPFWTSWFWWQRETSSFFFHYHHRNQLRNECKQINVKIPPFFCAARETDALWASPWHRRVREMKAWRCCNVRSMEIYFAVNWRTARIAGEVFHHRLIRMVFGCGGWFLRFSDE